MIDDRVDDEDDNNITRFDVEGRFHLRQAADVHFQVNYLKEVIHTHRTKTHRELKTCFFIALLPLHLADLVFFVF